MFIEAGLKDEDEDEDEEKKRNRGSVVHSKA
jgi:hypothetical protein